MYGPTGYPTPQYLGPQPAPRSADEVRARRRRIAIAIGFVLAVATLMWLEPADWMPFGNYQAPDHQSHSAAFWEVLLPALGFVPVALLGRVGWRLALAGPFIVICAYFETPASTCSSQEMATLSDFSGCGPFMPIPLALTLVLSIVGASVAAGLTWAMDRGRSLRQRYRRGGVPPRP